MSKQEILEAAAKIISQKGFHATSMQDIANAVNLQKASLYHHVSSKQEILVDLLDQALDMLIDIMGDVVSLDLPPDEKMRAAMREYLEVMTHRLDLASVLLMEHRSLEPKFHARHVPQRDKLENLWRSIIEEGIEQGIFICDDARLAVKTVLGVANWVVTWYSDTGPLTALQIAEHSSEMILRGLQVCG